MLFVPECVDGVLTGGASCGQRAGQESDGHDQEDNHCHRCRSEIAGPVAPPGRRGRTCKDVVGDSADSAATLGDRSGDSLERLTNPAAHERTKARSVKPWRRTLELSRQRFRHVISSVGNLYQEGGSGSFPVWSTQRSDSGHECGRREFHL